VANDDYVIRLAEPGEVSLLPVVERRAVVLFESCLAETGLTPETLYDVTSVEELAEAQLRRHVWVAVSPGGELVGFAMVLELGSIAHLDELDVLPEHGRRGLGSRLLGTVCAWARDAGYSKVTLTTFRDVAWNAPFYQRHGFHIVDPKALSEEHVQLVRSEAARGLRTDLRVVMEYRTMGE